MSRTSTPTETAAHPDWCAPDRCGLLVPPLLAHMARRHRGIMLRVGEVRASGLVVSYLIGVDGEPPVIAVHTSSRAGGAWAELRLSQADELVVQLQSLLMQAGYRRGEGDRERV
ncbi:hypothetical protein [Micromonospora globbae]|uniref:hypothetical protein n=1 Tax=Micromonospora globbae TaxID=1894969 RepID=UPI0034271513